MIDTAAAAKKSGTAPPPRQKSAVWYTGALMDLIQSGPKPSVKAARPVQEYKPHEGRIGGKGWGGSKCKYAKAGSTKFDHICKEDNACVKDDGTPVSLMSPTGRCEVVGRLEESKYKTRYVNPVKDRMTMLHEHLKRNLK